ncbi:MAG: hypothetical protein ACTSUE_09100 [Promethearchaeota archaeon]
MKVPKDFKLIGFTGTMGSGKDTAALHCIEQHNMIRLSFATPLKQACMKMFGFSHDQMHDTILKETIDTRWNKSPREVLQWMGTDVMREQFGPDFFVKRMEIEINNCVLDKIFLNKYDGIVITDVRFDNEAALIRGLGGSIVHIRRSQQNKSSTKRVKQHTEHVSESGISHNFLDQNIVNDGTLGKLFSQVDTLLTKL